MKQLIIILFLGFSINSFAQNQKIPHAEAVKTIDGVLTRMLQLLSVEKGETIDTESLRKLFLTNATFSVRAPDKSYPNPFETVSLDDFIASLKDSYYEQGFEEKEIGKVVNEFNGIANVFQSFKGSDSEENTQKGINSYQLVYLENRWWIANMIWTFETDTVKIPKKYLQKGK
ncbi:hypothetical protein C8N46_1114 [Kordia periserrulae]|uniref:Nuclear transport factor 2 family protein n=1 Tax=Kordia periserrulae TaxID=701523 RepID=A0A2T6BS63_9FLAO|nr:hypothetical protein [Kordia periserrulae]PTX58935.1 hypothetical protein C8N46_1114 [Kordia periserrulae]